jgi:flagellar biosynthesis chaperone FliJ
MLIKLEGKGRNIDQERDGWMVWRRIRGIWLWLTEKQRHKKGLAGEVLEQAKTHKGL